jgi:hypothetical protein
MDFSVYLNGQFSSFYSNYNKLLFKIISAKFHFRVSVLPINKYWCRIFKKNNTNCLSKIFVIM